jgi:hypothetical protein
VLNLLLQLGLTLVKEAHSPLEQIKSTLLGQPVEEEDPQVIIVANGFLGSQSFLHPRKELLSSLFGRAIDALFSSTATRLRLGEEPLLVKFVKRIVDCSGADVEPGLHALSLHVSAYLIAVHRPIQQQAKDK